MLTDASRRQLQRLKFLFEEALSRTQEPTEIGRHSALVLLDGACEYAMGIALGHRGQPIPRTFPQKFEALRAELYDWRPDAWASVLQLHEARNQVQHQGTVPDSRIMPSWAAQAQRFIDSLVAAAFDVELPSVLLADSIESEEVHHALVGAEQALLQQDAAAAFEAAIAGFDTAREAWRGQRAEAIGLLRLQYSGLSRLGGTIETDPTNLSLLRFEDLLEVQPFAPDIGETTGSLRGELRPKKTSSRRWKSRSAPSCSSPPGCCAVKRSRLVTRRGSFRRPRLPMSRR
jgi:hypothetical protein